VNFGLTSSVGIAAVVNRKYPYGVINSNQNEILDILA
jgi:hypothetical protein